MDRMKGEGKSVGVGRREGMVVDCHVLRLLLGLSKGMMGMLEPVWVRVSPAVGRYDKVIIIYPGLQDVDQMEEQEQEQATAKILAAQAPKLDFTPASDEYPPGRY